MSDNLTRVEEIHVHDYMNHESDPDHCILCCRQALSEERARTVQLMSGDFCDFCGGKHKIGDCPVNQVTPEYVDKEIDAVIKRQHGQFNHNLLQDDLRDCFSIIVSYFRRQAEESKARTLNSEAVQGMADAAQKIVARYKFVWMAPLIKALEKFQQFKDGK